MNYPTRLAVTAALDDLFSGSGEISADDIEMAFQRQQLQIVGLETPAKPTTTTLVSQISRALTGLGLVRRVRERWDDEPFDAIAIEDIEVVLEGLS